MARRQQVTSTLYPYLEIRFELRNLLGGGAALLDTGFTADLAVPEDTVQADLGPPDARSDWELADGSIIGAPAYFGTLEIVGLPSIPVVLTVLGNEYILGRGVLDRFRVTFDRGRRVVVTS